MNDIAATSQRIAAAADRLALSRQRLRLAMQGRQASPQNGGVTARAATPALAWLERLKSVPGLNIVVDLLNGWWAQHPWRVPTVLAAEAIDAMVQPVAKRHPLVLVLGAATLGALIVVSRPWRWLRRTPAPPAGVLPQLTSLLKTLTSPLALMALVAAFAPKSPEPNSTAATGQVPNQAAGASPTPA
ncbi:hypothetical protein [Rhodoferax sp.]|uniref:hypothetical protein n=1 Tax=Rhodoferax sp. TaxID=50421 RepID=UPI0027604E26|nr:hypothetical protein [Rhodoferax sp.]